MKEQIKVKVKFLADERSSSVRPLRVYSESFKVKVVKEVLSGKFSSKESARQHFGIRSKSAILDWMRLYSGAEGINKTGRLLKNRDNMSQELAKQSMRINSLPDNGAEVFLDGKRVGTTPFNNPKISSGKYLLKVTKEYFGGFEEQIVINDSGKIEKTISPSKKELKEIIENKEVTTINNPIGSTSLESK